MTELVKENGDERHEIIEKPPDEGINEKERNERRMNAQFQKETESAEIGRKSPNKLLKKTVETR